MSWSDASHRLLDPSALLLLSLLALIGRGYSQFTMLSQGQLMVLSAGDNVALECEFYMEYFNLFSNPVLWKKTQFHEESEINIMSNIKAPFDATDRFEASFNPLPPRYTLGMHIKNLSLEDSGNYTCEVRGQKSVKLGRVTHRIFVRAPVQRIAISQQNASAMDPVNLENERSLLFIENEPRPLCCAAIGGNPPPDMTITIGKRDYTNKFTVQTYPRLSGPRGFRTMHTDTLLRTDTFVANADDDSRRIKCIVNVPGLQAKMVASRIQVQYAPRIMCVSPVYASMGDTNIKLTCEIKARPIVSTLFWVLDVNGTSVAHGEIVNEYWTLVVDRSDGIIESALYLRKARTDSFRKYTVVAENEVAVKTQDVILAEKIEPSRRPQVASSGHRSSTADSGGTRNGYIFLPSGTSCVHVTYRAFYSTSLLCVLIGAALVLIQTS